MRTITAIVITVALLFGVGGGVASLTDNSVATVQALPRIQEKTVDSPAPETTPAETDANQKVTPTEQEKLTRQEALDIAFAAANVAAEAVYDLEAELDLERAGLVWEVDFDCEKIEYEYDIDAITGQILKSRKEAPKAQTEKPTNPQPAPVQPEAKPEVTQKTISRSKAQELALKHAGVTSARDLDAELDREKGQLVWEVDFEAGGYDYEYVLDAYTGKILRSHKERD